MEDIKMTATKAPYAKLKPALDAAFSSVMSNMSFEEGPQVELFARSLESFYQIQRALPCVSGVEALKVTLQLLQLPPQAEVVVPAYGDAELVEVLVQLGLKPVFADIDSSTLTITAATVEKILSPDTKAVIASHLFGQCAPVFELMEMCRNRGVWLVEDASNAFGAVCLAPEGKERRAGAVGHIGFTNFYPTKPTLDAGEGAAVLINSTELGVSVQQMQEQGTLNEEIQQLRLGTLQAAMMEVKLPFVDEYNAMRQEVAKLYNTAFSGKKGIQTPQDTPDAKHIYQQYTIAVAPELRDGLQQYLYDNYIPSAAYFTQSLKLQETPVAGSLTAPVAEQIVKSTLSLPLHSELKEDQLAYICQHVINYVKQNT